MDFESQHASTSGGDGQKGGLTIVMTEQTKSVRILTCNRNPIDQNDSSF